MSKRKLNLQLFAVNNFIPQIWSAQLLQSLKNTLIFGQEGIINKNYQGEISQYGDTVKINTYSAVLLQYIANPVCRRDCREIKTVKNFAISLLFYLNYISAIYKYSTVFGSFNLISIDSGL